MTRYDDVLTVLKDDRFAKDKTKALSAEQLARLPWMPSIFKPLESNMLDLDQPDHTRLRGLVHQAFTPRLIDNMRDRVQALTDELLDQAESRGRMDLIHDYALPLPATIIAEILGVPARDRHRFHRWSKCAPDRPAVDVGKAEVDTARRGFHALHPDAEQDAASRAA